LRIAILATGSRGDVEPYIALGKALKEKGSYVRILSHQNFSQLVNSYGLEFWPITGNVQEIAQSCEMSKRIEKGSFLSVISQMKKDAKTQAIEAVKKGTDACEGIDIILAGLAGLFTGYTLAEKHNIPLTQVYYIPLTPTRSFPSFLFYKMPKWTGSFANKLSFHITRQIIWQGFRSVDNLTRKEILHLKKAPLWGPYRKLSDKDQPVLYGYSPSLLPTASDWDANTHVTGFWFLEEPTDWKPPQELLDFLESGDPPIYIGFGSMSSKNPEETTKLVLAALEETDQRAIVSSGWNGLTRKDLLSSVFMIDTVPFSWLFPKMAAIVHHGGAGTTHHGVRAGVPSIVIPFFADQPFWGNRIKELGVGPGPIPRKRLTAKRLASAISIAVTDIDMRRRAKDLGAKVREEKGLETAVKIITENSSKQ
jgi:sterol 3beta-glucosyltransferase